MNVLVCAHLYDHEINMIKEQFPDVSFMINQSPNQEDINKADIIIGNPPKNMNLNHENLKALLLNSAGSDAYIKEGILHPNTKLANASGSYGTAISEYVVGMMIALCKNFKPYTLQMTKQNWHPLSTGKEIYHRRVCIVGYGDIGHEIAKRLTAFDCEILAVKRRKQDHLPYCHKVYNLDQLDDLLPLCDFVILALPQNQQTIHLFNKERLLKMKKDAILINVGRGSAIVSEDLIDVLNQGYFYGVGLDVVDPEPLLKSSPLWNFDRVMITPHSSGGLLWPSVREYYLQLVIKNMHHILHGEHLENEVDFKTGYCKIVHYK